MKPSTLLTNKPISFEDQGNIFYFEIKIKQIRSNKQNIIIGLCDKEQSTGKVLGYTKNSWGY